MDKPKIFADFHNADSLGRPRLNTIGTVRDLARQQVRLQEGLELVLYSEDVEAEGKVQYSSEERLWVAVIDWEKLGQKAGLPTEAMHPMS